MKKLRCIAIAATLCVLLTFALVACGEKEQPPLDKYDAPYDNLMAETYKDYAAETQLNTQDYPELSRQGLRLITGYSESYAYGDEGMPSDVDVIRKHFDPNKGIIVIINGLQLNIGRDHNANMQSDSRLDELEIFGDDNEIDYFREDQNSAQTYDLGKYWMDNGYNVFYFHWEMFADFYEKGNAMDTLNAPFNIQEKVWSCDNGVTAAFVRDGKAQATLPNEALNGNSVAEWFAGDYLRMANAVKEAFPQYGTSAHDVRFAGHSMGGTLTVAASALLNLLCQNGKVEKGFVPNRLALMDSYLGDSNQVDYTISWSGKPYVRPEGSDRCCNYLAALDMLVNKFGVAAEFVCNEGFVVPFLSIEGIKEVYYDESIHGFEGANAVLANKVLELCPIVVVRPYFSAVGGVIAFNGHNPIREWYLSTILYDAPVAEGGVTVPTARMSDEDVRANRGRYFVMTNDRVRRCETVRCDDDTFTLNRTEVIIEEEL